MLIYDFIRKVQDEHDAAVREATRLDGLQHHDKARRRRVRVQTLYEVLTWAGFEDCDVVKREGT